MAQEDKSTINSIKKSKRKSSKVETQSIKRARSLSWRLPSILHELLLYGELFALCCAVFVIHTLTMLPWNYITRLSSLTPHPLLYSSRIDLFPGESKSIIAAAQFYSELEKIIENTSISSKKPYIFLVSC